MVTKAVTFQSKFVRKLCQQGRKKDSAMSSVSHVVVDHPVNFYKKDEKKNL